jgi:hypothetical protein
VEEVVREALRHPVVRKAAAAKPACEAQLIDVVRAGVCKLAAIAAGGAAGGAGEGAAGGAGAVPTAPSAWLDGVEGVHVLTEHLGPLWKDVQDLVPMLTAAARYLADCVENDRLPGRQYHVDAKMLTNRTVFSVLGPSGKCEWALQWCACAATTLAHAPPSSSRARGSLVLRRLRVHAAARDHGPR